MHIYCNLYGLFRQKETPSYEGVDSVKITPHCQGPQYSHTAITPLKKKKKER